MFCVVRVIDVDQRPGCRVAHDVSNEICRKQCCVWTFSIVVEQISVCSEQVHFQKCGEFCAFCTKMALDDCPPSVDPTSGPANLTRIRLSATQAQGRRRGQRYDHDRRLDEANERTIRWLERCRDAHARRAEHGHDLRRL